MATRSPARACRRPGTPSSESPRSSSGSQKASSTRRRMTSTGAQALERAQPDALVADGQIVALRERAAEIAGEEGVLEVRLVARPGREHDDVRTVVGARRERGERRAQAAEEERQPVHVRSRGRGSAARATARRGSRARSRLPEGAWVRSPRTQKRPSARRAEIGGVERQARPRGGGTPTHGRAKPGWA